MTEDNVVMLASKQGSGKLWSPKELFIDSIRRHAEELPSVKKVIIIFYDDTNEDYRQRINWSQCGMDRSQMINLLDLTKNDILFELLSDIEEYV